MDISFNAFDYFCNALALAILFIPLYYCIPKLTGQRILLTFMGMLLLFYIAPRLLLAYIIFWFLFYLLQLIIARFSTSRWSLYALWGTILLTLAPMLSWKIIGLPIVNQFNFYSHTILWKCIPILGQIDAISKFVIPIGLSFATFRAIDLLIKIYLFELPRFSFLSIFFFGFFPPVQPLGPIIEYTEINLGTSEKNGIKYNKENIIAGLLDVVLGTIKIYCLAYPLQFSASIFANAAANPPFIIFASMLIFTFYFYFNFAGYSSIAIGLARMFGFKLLPNFNYPLFQNNPQAFWANWHMGLTRFAQRYIFVPLGGFRQKTQFFAIFATMMVIALWHDLTLQWFLFGIYHGCAIALHRFYTNKKGNTKKTTNERWYRNLWKKTCVVLYMTMGFPIIMVPPANLLNFYKTLVGL